MSKITPGRPASPPSSPDSARTAETALDEGEEDLSDAGGATRLIIDELAAMIEAAVASAAPASLLAPLVRALDEAERVVSARGGGHSRKTLN